ncbi:hypothetical protein Tco_1427651 [Tanacetum coccineum]
MIDTVDEEMLDATSGKLIDVLVQGVVHRVCEDVNQAESSLIQGSGFASFGSPNVIVALLVEKEKKCLTYGRGAWYAGELCSLLRAWGLSEVSIEGHVLIPTDTCWFMNSNRMNDNLVNASAFGFRSLGRCVIRNLWKGSVANTYHTDEVQSPPDHPKDKSGLDASAKLTRAKLNKRSRDADLSKDKSGLESPPEFRRSWCVKGHSRSGVISFFLTQRYLRTIRQRSLLPSLSSPRKFTLTFGAIRGTRHPNLPKRRKPKKARLTLNLWRRNFREQGQGTQERKPMRDPPNQSYKRKKPLLFFAIIKENIDVLRNMIKKHDQQSKMKATPRKLAYANSDKEAPTRSLAKGFFDRFSLESSGTSDTYRQTRSASKSQRTPSKNKEPTHLRRLKRMEDRSITKEKARGKGPNAEEKGPDTKRQAQTPNMRKVRKMLMKT